MNDLDKKKCLPCEGGLDPLSKDECQIFLDKLNKDWSLSKDIKSIERTFTRKNHNDISSLINLIIHISNIEDHHPEVTFGYNTAVVKYFTYAIDGLSENDFICAAKLDKITSI
jgi:4a-hydroxytetrahydrobiopterin dehydratase